MGLIFEIAEGEALNVDVNIEGHDGRDIHSDVKESNEKYTFATHLDSVYKYCFSNKMSTITPRVVMFNMEIGEALEASEDTVLTGATHEQEYMEVRDRICPTLTSNKVFKCLMILGLDFNGEFLLFCHFIVGVMINGFRKLGSDIGHFVSVDR